MEEMELVVDSVYDTGEDDCPPTQPSLTTEATTSLNPITSPSSATLSDAATLNCMEPANSMADLANDGAITAAEMPLSTFAPSTYTEFEDASLSQVSWRPGPIRILAVHY
ncbi:hypothetical protein GN958_ATG22186 [Phytophthora infestans]|nr:hypothetical protein GN958_ATG22186 [Phytophthora infestans]